MHGAASFIGAVHRAPGQPGQAVASGTVWQWHAQVAVVFWGWIVSSKTHCGGGGHFDGRGPVCV